MASVEQEPERELVYALARQAAAGVSARLAAHWMAYGREGIDAFVERSYWELGFGRLDAPECSPRVMVVGINPSEDQLLAEPVQPWGVLPLAERIQRWRQCDAWTLGETDRARFELLNGGLAFGGAHTWAFFARLRGLFRRAGAEELLRGSYCTNVSKFTSASVAAAGAEFDQEIQACRPVLLEQVRRVAPRVLVAVGVGEAVPAVRRLFVAAGGRLALKRTAVVGEKGSCGYYAGKGELPGLAHPVLVVGLPHTSSAYAHANFDPYVAGLAEILAADLVMERLMKENA